MLQPICALRELIEDRMTSRWTTSSLARRTLANSDEVASVMPSPFSKISWASQLSRTSSSSSTPSSEEAGMDATIWRARWTVECVTLTRAEGYHLYLMQGRRSERVLHGAARGIADSLGVTVRIELTRDGQSTGLVLQQGHA